MTVAPVSASVGVTLGLSPSPDGLLVATGPFPVSWQAVPATAGQRAVSWELTLTPDSAGTAFIPGEIVTLPAATRSYLVDPQALGWTPYSSWRISVAGVDSAGERFIVSDSEFVSYEP